MNIKKVKRLMLCILCTIFVFVQIDCVNMIADETAAELTYSEVNKKIVEAYANSVAPSEIFKSLTEEEVQILYDYYVDVPAVTVFSEEIQNSDEVAYIDALANQYYDELERRGEIENIPEMSQQEIDELLDSIEVSMVPNASRAAICYEPENPCAIDFQKISEPTISMQFIVNDSPFAGQEGKFVTSRHIRDRLFRELNTDVSLRVEETENADNYKVSGRGELHLSVLIENMRREGYEFAVSKAEVLYKTDENGKKLEPMEAAFVDVPDEFTGTVIDKLSQRKGELQGMNSIGSGYTRLEFSIPARGLIGYRGEFLTDTKGNGILNTSFDGYAPYKGDIQYRKQGSLIAFETGESVTYGLYSAQERGTLFIGPGEKVYSGMVVGQNAKTDDIELNVCKTKHLTNTRSSSADEALRLTPPHILSLEQALDFIDTDELLEVTPKSLRIRKKILDSRLRKRSNQNQQK